MTLPHAWRYDERGDGMPERLCTACGERELVGMAGLGPDFGPLFTRTEPESGVCSVRTNEKKRICRLEQQLENEGFTKISTVREHFMGNYCSLENKFASPAAYLIATGEMRVFLDGKWKTCDAGARVDIPAGTPVTRIIGFHGCTYVLGTGQDSPKT